MTGLTSKRSQSNTAYYTRKALSFSRKFVRYEFRVRDALDASSGSLRSSESNSTYSLKRGNVLCVAQASMEAVSSIRCLPADRGAIVVYSKPVIGIDMSAEFLVD
jgi:hypothetical protein